MPELAAYDTFVAQLAADDPDVGEVLTFRWVDELHGTVTGRRAFDIDAVSGRVYVMDSSYLDYETSTFIELTVDVVDSAGLTDERTVLVDLIDRDTQPQVFTVPFLSEDQLLVDPTDELMVTAFESWFPSTDLNTGEEEADLVGLTAGTSLTMHAEMEGNIGQSWNIDATPPMATVYMPIEVSIEFPDDIVLGQPFEVLTDWTLQDDAVITGNTLGLEVSLSMDFEDIAFDMFSPGVELVNGGAFNAFTESGTMTFGLDAEPITGAKLSVLRPEGTSWGQPPDLDLACVVTTDLCDDVPSDRVRTPDGTEELAEEQIGMEYVDPSDFTRDEWAQYCPEVPYRPTFRRCDLADPDALWRFAYTNTLGMKYGPNADITGDDVIVSPGVKSRLLRIPTNPVVAMADSGLPALFKLWGTTTMPVPGVGYHELEYSLYEAPIYGTLDSHELYATTADGVIATLTFEGGTSVTAELREGFGEITLPVDEDVNGDGRVDMTLDLELDATMLKFWLWDIGIDSPTTVLAWSARSYLYDYDFSGNIVGETLVGEDGWGPVYQSDLEWSTGASATQDLWPAPGFEVVSLPGALQVTAP